MSFITTDPFTTRPEIKGTFGVVATTHWIASSVGMGVLERGGNAIDAGVAANFTLQIVEPHLNGPGGDAPIMIHDAKSGAIKVICGQGIAPRGLTIAHCKSLGLDLVPGSGLLATCVPGTFDALMVALRDYGTVKLREVLEPAIFYARHGYPVVERITATIQTVAELFRKEWPTSAALYLPGGSPPAPGSVFRNEKLADTYERILREAESAGGDRVVQIERARLVWAEGFVAEAIDKFVRSQELMDSSGRRNKGVLAGDDMARWRAHEEAPAHYDYGRYRVLKPGGWCQGIATLQQLALLKGFDLDKMPVTGPDFVHTVVEAAKLAFADRDTFLGDPDFVDVPLDVLLSDAYNDARRKLITGEASHEQRPGRIEGRGKALETRASDAIRAAVGAFGTGEPTVGRLGEARGDTVHYDVIDRWGNMIAATPSGGWLQSSPIIPELGFCLGSRAQMFVLDAEHPAALGEGRRPRTTLSPTMALRDGDAYLAWGSPGGDQQDQWIPQMLLRHIHAGMNLQEAIDAPAFHTEHFPQSFWPRLARPGVVVVEGRMPKATVEELKRRGHKIEVGEDWSEGRLVAAAKDGALLKAAANPRGMQGYAVGR
ncbi:MAG TPA: gamma-glutamyltransferase family protein [Hyphomicrobiaceae bacterium]|nr:gamma-glutamyltransferase family protein [Hyphomicrobiaceae bacterium]